MGNWWEQKPRDDSPQTSCARAVAYYRHSAQDRQENSIPLQQEQVREWAREHHVEIIHEFVDPGRSGLTAEGRPGFNEMMDDWVRKRFDFQYVLCLDVSRWGRFQDIDLSAQYSAECKRHGKTVVYTTIGMPREDDPLYPVYVQFERFRAAQYSRELSDKVFRGCVRIAQQGYWAGGSPPYGLARVLLDESRRPLHVLKPGERKSIQNQRVTLAAGDKEHAAIVRRAFRELTERARDTRDIAEGLNRDGVPSPGGKRWDSDKVLRLLKQRKYAGAMVYNQTTQRLKTPSRANPEEDWINALDAFKGLVSREVFERAQEILAEAERRFEPETMLRLLEELLGKYGIIRASMLRKTFRTPSASTYAKRFGSLNTAMQKLYFEAHAIIRERVRQQIASLVERVETYDDFLVINQKLTVLVQPSVPMPYGLTQYWYFEPDRRTVVDITLGVPLASPTESRILGYLVFPRLTVRDRRMRVFGTSASRIDMHGQEGLGFIQQLANGRGAS